MAFQFDPIGTLHTCFKEKFGIPRQSNLVDAPGTLVFHPEYAREEAIRGLEAFSHIWLVFIFHEAMEDRHTARETANNPEERTDSDTSMGRTHTNRTWAPMVRPPRLGGNKKVGVFSSRSPFRPNPIGISAVRLESVELGRRGPRLHLTGVDILDQTPILDIKPYIPYADAISQADDGFAPAPLQNRVDVTYSETAREQIQAKEKEIAHLDAMIRGLLSNDPRPAYHAHQNANWGEGRIFGIRLFDFDLKWTVKCNQIVVLSLEPT